MNIQSHTGHFNAKSGFRDSPASAELERIIEQKSPLIRDAYTALTCLETEDTGLALQHIHELSFRRAFDLVLSGAADTSDFSTLIIDQLAVDTLQQKHPRHSAAERLKIAEGYAERLKLSADDAFDLQCYFADCHYEFKKLSPQNVEPVRFLSDVTLTIHPESPAFHAGTRALDGLFTGRGGKSGGISSGQLTGEDWDTIKAGLNERMGHLAATHPLRVMLSTPVTPTAAPSTPLPAGAPVFG